MIENAYIHFFERKRITGSDIIFWSPPPQRFGDKLQRVKKRCRHSFVFFKTNVWFYVTWSLVALSLVVTRTFQLELERFCTLAWLFWGYCICSNQFLHHSACLQFSSLALVLSYGITGALKVFFSSREHTNFNALRWTLRLSEFLHFPPLTPEATFFQQTRRRL